MNISMISAAVLTLSVSAFTAQAAPQISSTIATKATDHHGFSPGTVGAMAGAALGVATSPIEVKRQQEGRGLDVNEGNGRSVMTDQSPGTVGASPGYTSANRH